MKDETEKKDVTATDGKPMLGGVCSQCGYERNKLYSFNGEKKDALTV